MATTEIEFDLDLSTDEYLRYYQGEISAVLVKACNGKTLSFPASRLRSFVDDSGVHGRFRLRYDQDHRLVSIERISR